MVAYKGPGEGKSLFNPGPLGRRLYTSSERCGVNFRLSRLLGVLWWGWNLGVQHFNHLIGHQATPPMTEFIPACRL